MINLSKIATTFLLKQRCKSFICYTECDLLFFSGLYGAFKLCLFSDSIFFVEDFFFFRAISMFSLNTAFIFFKAAFFLNIVFSKLHGVLFGFLCKFKIKGLGYRLFIYRNSYIFRLGYSHNIYFLLPLNILGVKKRHKKHIFFALRSIHNISMFHALSIIQSFRLPDIYNRNGIFKRTDFFFLKVGKKSFML